MALFSVPIALARPSKPRTDQTNVCAAGKLEAGGTYIDDSLACLSKAGTESDQAFAVCVRNAARKLKDTFAKYESTGACSTTGESASFKAFIDPAISDLAASLGGAARSRCTRQKLIAAGEAAAGKYGCQSRAIAIGPGFGMDLACWVQAGEELTEAFERAETKGDCAAGTGDAAAIDASIDALVIKARGVISPAASSCAPVEVTTVHGDNFHGNSRLTRIENGTVPCLHVDDGTLAVCRFSPASASGEWLESPDGAFAKVGQAVSLDGTPGGDYIVAARLTMPRTCRAWSPRAWTRRGGSHREPSWFFTARLRRI